jgi:hypothetical protein
MASGGEHKSARLDPRHLVHDGAAERLGDRNGRAAQEVAVREEPERVGVPVEILEPRDEVVVERHR